MCSVTNHRPGPLWEIASLKVNAPPRDDESAGYMHQHLGSGLDLYFFTALHGDRTCAAGAAENQTDGRAFAAAGDAADDCAGSRADAAALECLFAATFRLDAAFFVGAISGSVNFRHVTVQHAVALVRQSDRVESQVHRGAALDAAGLDDRTDVS